MMRVSLIGAFIALGALASCGESSDADPAKPAAFAVNLPVEAASGDGLQRVVLPPAVLTAVQRADMGDIRIFDGRGRQVPLARAPGRALEDQTSQPVPVYPVAGWGGTGDPSKVTVNINGNTFALEDDKAGAKGKGGSAILDLRKLEDPVVALALDAELPAKTPVIIRLESSETLEDEDWNALSTKVFFRPEDGAALLGSNRISLPSVDLRNHYVRAIWDVERVSIQAATAITSKGAIPVRQSVTTTGLQRIDAHDLRFRLPVSAGPVALQINQNAPDGLIPVRIFTRNSEEAAWQLASVATIRPPASGEASTGDNMVEIPRSAGPFFRIEADQRTSGFSAAPTITLLFEPVEIVAAFTGTPPYTLAAGMNAAPPVWLDATQIAPGGLPANLPVAQTKGVASAPSVSIDPTEASGLALGRKSILWLVLLLGTAVLGFALYRLIRSPQPADPSL